jgi:peptide methionine sulfoxide reductase MsrB
LGLITKYNAGPGWPSFTKPIDGNNVVLKEERGFFSRKTVAKSRNADSYLGDVFFAGLNRNEQMFCTNPAL